MESRNWETLDTREAAWARFSTLMRCDVRNLVVWGCPLDAPPVRLWSDSQENARRDAQAFRAFHVAADRDRECYTPDLDDVDLAEIAAEARLNCY